MLGFGNRVPVLVREAAGGRVVAHARGEQVWVAATPTHLVEVPDAGAPGRVPWHEVERGVWDRAQSSLSVRLVGGRELSWVFPEDAPTLVQTVHERVGASVVQMSQVSVPTGKARVVLRKDLSSRQLFVQTSADDGVDLTSPQAQRLVEEAAASLREQAGL